MNTSNSHQEFKKGYNVPEGEEKFFHILFLDRTVNMRSKTVAEKFSVQRYKPGEWRVIKKHIETPGIGIGVTGHDEFSILHDPTIEPKEAPKKPGRKPATDKPKDE
jgi:hypothetical protein